MYRTEPPTDKTIREWYMKFQQSGCLCAAKRRSRPRPSTETVERVRETFVRSPQKSTRVHISSICKVGQKLGVSLPLLTCSPSAWPSRLLYRRGRKSRRDLWITLYNHLLHVSVVHRQLQAATQIYEQPYRITIQFCRVTIHSSYRNKIAAILKYTDKEYIKYCVFCVRNIEYNIVCSLMPR